MGPDLCERPAAVGQDPAELFEVAFAEVHQRRADRAGVEAGEPGPGLDDRDGVPGWLSRRAASGEKNAVVNSWMVATSPESRARAKA